MDKSIKIVRIPSHTEKWYDFRKYGIGGSEIATVLGINKYDTAARLYHEKIGNIEPRQISNQRIFWGNRNEPLVADVWQYYDNTKDGYIENYNNKKIVRKCRQINGFVINPKYPWLFGSLDRVINIEGGVNFINGELLTKEAVLEIKNMGHWAAQAWEDGLPIYHLTQVMGYMIIIESDYAEIATLIDGGELVVEKVAYDDELAQRILRITKSFWYDRVIPGKKAVEMRDKCNLEGDVVGIEKWEAVIQKYEPDPDDTKAYEEFQAERFVKERESIQGSPPLEFLAKKDRFYMSLGTRVEKEQAKIRNQFRKIFTVNGVEVIDFGKLGSVSWTEKKNVKNRSFSNGFKEKPDEDLIDERFLNIDFDY